MDDTTEGIETSTAGGSVADVLLDVIRSLSCRACFPHDPVHVDTAVYANFSLKCGCTLCSVCRERLTANCTVCHSFEFEPIIAIANNHDTWFENAKNAYAKLTKIVMLIYVKHSKNTQKITYVLDDCRLHMRLMKVGIGSIDVRNKSTIIRLTNCAPDRLVAFMNLLQHKLDVKQSLANGPRVNRTRKYCRALSPISTNDVNHPQRNGLTAKLESDVCVQDEVNRKSSHIQISAETKAERINQPNDPFRLSEEQKQILRIIFNDRQNLFFTGAAGTGKSVVLKKIVGLLPAATSFITAATGVAACQIGGTTLHSCVGIEIEDSTSAECVELIKQKKQVAAQWRTCTHLVIDEISMIGADCFEKLEFIARSLRKNKKPFGGIQLIITGDFLQLPPVTKKGRSVEFCFQSPIWSKCIKRTVVLQTVHRQRDGRFIAILNQIRTGRCDFNATADIQNTAFNNFSDKKGIVPTKLCTHANDADAVNIRNLELLKGVKHHFTAQDSSNNSETLNRYVPKELVLKTDAQVMLTRNINLSQGLSNGSRGVIRKFSSEGYPVVVFNDERSPDDGIEIKPYSFTTRGKDNEGIASRRQIPLVLAWAISIHKSQGLTLDAVEVCLSRVFAEGQAYVALSRAKSLKSICVIGFESRFVSANRHVVRYYEELKKSPKNHLENEVLKKMK